MAKKPELHARPAASNREVRIIAGQWRGRRLAFHESEGLRPTGDRVRETVFNWLQGVIEGADCLDLFAGSGALAFEAASRGAARVVLVEKGHLVLRQLQSQIALFNAASLVLWQGGALDYLAQHNHAFDIIFLDPPFQGPLLQQTLDNLIQGGHVKPHGYCYVEYPRRQPPRPPEGWVYFRQKQTGDMGFGLIRRDVEGS